MVEVHRPSDWREAKLVEVESDAPDNTRAIIEIEEWAAQNGLLRTNKRWLPSQVRSDQKVVRRAVCYRPTSEQISH